MCPAWEVRNARAPPLATERCCAVDGRRHARPHHKMCPAGKVHGDKRARAVDDVGAGAPRMPRVVEAQLKLRDHHGDGELGFHLHGTAPVYTATRPPWRRRHGTRLPQQGARLPRQGTRLPRPRRSSAPTRRTSATTRHSSAPTRRTSAPTLAQVHVRDRRRTEARLHGRRTDTRDLQWLVSDQILLL